jgi:hypothetical protein
MVAINLCGPIRSTIPKYIRTLTTITEVTVSSAHTLPLIAFLTSFDINTAQQAAKYAPSGRARSYEGMPW